MPPADRTGTGSTDTTELRIRMGFQVIVAGFILIGVTVVAAVVIWSLRTAPATGTAGEGLKISDLAAFIAPVTGVVGTIVGAFFGVNASGAARDQMNAARQDAQKLSNHALADSPPEVGNRAIVSAGADPS